MALFASQLQLAGMRMKGKRLKRPLPVQPPISIEREYLRDLQAFLRVIQTQVQVQLIPKIKGLVSDYDATRGVKRDAVSDDVDDIFDSIQIEVEQNFSEDQRRLMAQRRGIETSNYNRKAIEKNVKRVVNIDVFMSDPFLTDEIALFTAGNVTLINSMEADAYKNMETIIYNGLRAGSRADEIADQIEKYIDPSVGNISSRAQLIARDQISKLNGNLNFLRQKQLGVERYVWRTTMDDRVRESHASKEGNIYSWDNPPSDTGHPGEDINCRCYAEPYLDDLVPDDDEE